MSDEQTPTPEEQVGGLFKSGLDAGKDPLKAAVETLEKVDPKKSMEAGSVEVDEEGKAFVDGKDAEGKDKPEAAPLVIGETKIPPKAGSEWDETVTSTIVDACQKAGIDEAAMIWAFDNYRMGMRSTPYSFEEGMGLLEQMHGPEGARTTINLAKENLARLNHPGLSKLVEETDLGSDPFLISLLSAIKIPEPSVWDEPEPEIPSDKGEAKQMLDQIMADPDHPYFEGSYTIEGQRALRLVTRLYELIYGP